MNGNLYALILKKDGWLKFYFCKYTTQDYNLFDKYLFFSSFCKCKLSLIVLSDKKIFHNLKIYKLWLRSGNTFKQYC